MMRVMNVVKDKIKFKLIETHFCLGIGLDQLTPHYFPVVFKHVVGQVIENTRPVDAASIHNKPINTDKKFKPNYNKRASFKK